MNTELGSSENFRRRFSTAGVPCLAITGSYNIFRNLRSFRVLQPFSLICVYCIQITAPIRVFRRESSVFRIT